MGFLDTIGNAIAAKLMPIVEAKGQILLDRAEEKAGELLVKVGDRIEAEIDRRLPIIIEAVVVAVTKTMGDLAIKGSDRLTDMIPGQLDDQIIDPLVGNVVAEIKRRFGIQF